MDRSTSNGSSKDKSKKSRTNVNTACQIRVANTEKARKALWKSYDYRYDDNNPPTELPGDGDGTGGASDDEADEVVEDSSEWILKKSTKRLKCPHYRQLSTARTANMTRSNFLVSQETIDCCKSGGEKTKMGAHDIEDLISFGLNPYLKESVVLYRRNKQESFGFDVGTTDCKIQAIQDNSPAKFCAQLRRGDKILKVNGVRVLNANVFRKQMAKATKDTLELTLTILKSTSPSNSNQFTTTKQESSPATKDIEVFLNRLVGQRGFGMTLAGNTNSKGCVVDAVKPFSAAEKSGNVKKGDLIVAIRSFNVEDLPYEKVVKKFQAEATKPGPLRLTLRRPGGNESASNADEEDPYSPHSACPYFLSRALAKHAELIFAPYNYILDPGIRNALEIDLDGSVVVLDEGHNVEGVLTESGSGKYAEIELSNLVATLAYASTAAKSHKTLIQVKSGEIDSSEIAHELLIFVEKLVLYMRSQKAKFEQSPGNLGARKAIEDYRRFHTPDDTEFEVSYSGPNGHGLRGKAVGCDPFFDSLKISVQEVEKLREYATAMDKHLKGSDQARAGDGTNDKGRDSAFELLVDLLSKFGMARENPEHYYVSCVVQANGNLDHAAGDQVADDDRRGRRFKKKPANMPFIHPRSAINPNAPLSVCNHKACKQHYNGSVLSPSYRSHGVRHGEYCTGVDIPAWEAHLKIRLLFPGLLMKDLATQCRTVVLASGSISPLTSLCAELDLRGPDALKPGRLQTVPKPLCADHVINLPKQLLCAAVGVFSNGKPLTVSYNHYKHSDFFPRLGDAIATICESIPFGGVLVFLPSRSLLTKCLKCWNPSSYGGGFSNYYRGDDNFHPEIWERLIQSKGKVIVEPAGSQEAFESARDEYAETIKASGSCILFAIFRGKMSEGISFNDDNARGVICVGLPFPPLKDRNIEAKKNYNDEQRKLKQRTDLLPSGEWYAQEAYRAVAQALGRCIRHEGDFGTIVLLDSRHCDDGSPGVKHGNLPKWMRASVRTLAMGNRGHGVHPILGGYPGLKKEMKSFFSQAPGYAASVVAKRKKEFEDALKRENQSATIQYDSKKGWTTGSSTTRNAPQRNRSSSSTVTQDSPMLPSIASGRVKQENGVIDLLTPSPTPSISRQQQQVARQQLNLPQPPRSMPPPPPPPQQQLRQNLQHPFVGYAMHAQPYFAYSYGGYGYVPGPLPNPLYQYPFATNPQQGALASYAYAGTAGVQAALQQSSLLASANPLTANQQQPLPPQQPVIPQPAAPGAKEEEDAVTKV